MAKCAMCQSKKGQRDCKVTNSQVCSLCCGLNRKLETCSGCEHFKSAKSTRSYSGVPRFSTMEMENDFDLQSHSNSIEGTLCAWDNSFQNSLKDESLIKVLEMLLDKHYFHDEDVSSPDAAVQKGFEMVSQSMKEDIADLPDETIVKILGVIHYVAKRRARGGRDHFEILQQYVGVRVASGMRSIPNPKGLR